MNSGSGTRVFIALNADSTRILGGSHLYEPYFEALPPACKIRKIFVTKSFKSRSRVVPESFRSRSGVFLESFHQLFYSHFRVIPENFWSHSGVIPESFWSHSRVILESFQSHFGVVPESFWCRSKVIRGLLKYSICFYSLIIVSKEWSFYISFIF